MRYYKINAQTAGMRLDKFLVEKLGLSRSKLQKDIKAGLILVNKDIAKVHEFLSVGDIVSFRRAKSVDAHNMEHISHNTRRRVLHAPCSMLHDVPQVLLERPDFLIIDKPAGLLVHEKAGFQHPTLVDWLVEKYPEIKKVHDSASLERNDMTFRPGIVHRLDKDVSGVMIVARTQDAYDHLKRQFKLKKVQKEYIALVFGRMAENMKTLLFPIGRSASGKFVAMPKNAENAKPAETEIEVIERLGGNTLVKAFPKTGRTNQIRAHLAAAGFPIIGDELYMNDKVKNKQKIKPGRVFLHAAKLTFEAPNGEMMAVESKLPKELRMIIGLLR